MSNAYSKYKEYNNNLSSTDYLKNKIDKLLVILENTDLINELSSNLSTKDLKYVELDNKVNDYEQAVTNEVRQEKFFNEKLEELFKIRKEFEGFKQELGICPLCGGKL